MDKEFYNLKNADPEDIEGVLLKIQRSFNIQFDNDGLKNVTTFGNLCDLIVSKVNLEHEDTCTTQHAFYLLRNAIAASSGQDKCSITPHTKLCNIFPRDNRLQMIGEIERDLGFETHLLQPKQWVLTVFVLLFIGSLIGCYFNWQIGVGGILVSLTALKLAGKFGKEIHLKTVGDMANKIARESYLKARRNSTINRNEIEQKVKELFESDLNLQPIMVRRNSSF